MIGWNTVEDIKSELIKEWSVKNDRRPSEYTYCSAWRVLWNCSTCGGEYAETIRNRKGNMDECPYCDNRRPLQGFNKKLN